MLHASSVNQSYDLLKGVAHGSGHQGQPISQSAQAADNNKHIGPFQTRLLDWEIRLMSIEGSSIPVRQLLYSSAVIVVEKPPWKM